MLCVQEEKSPSIILNMTRMVVLEQLHLRNQHTLRRKTSSVLWRPGMCGLLLRGLGGHCVQRKFGASIM